jgi:hypothetical protein
MRTGLQLTILASVLLLVAGTASATLLLTNGDFETGTPAGWTVTDLAGGSGSFFVSSDLTTPLSGFPTVGPAGGLFYAVSDQTGPGTHALSQSFTVAAGSKVILAFDMFVNDWSDVGPIVDPCGLNHTCVPNQHARVDILAAGAGAFDTGAGVLANFYLGVDAGTDPNPYTHYSFDISSLVGVGGTFVLRFAEVDNQLFLNQGVDNVSIEATAPVPEPATAGLLGAGLLGLAAARRRRHARGAVSMRVPLLSHDRTALVKSLFAACVGMCSLLPIVAEAQTADQPIFGPKQYLRAPGPPTEYVDPVAVPDSIVAPFVLEIVKASGPPYTAAWVTVNGVQVARPADFVGPTVVSRQVTLDATNQLVVRLAGQPGTSVTIILYGTAAPPPPPPPPPADDFLTDFTPEGIATFLAKHPDVRSAAKFLERLKAEEFKQYWIMMTRSESVQTGTAKQPRFIVPNKEADKVFGFEIDSDFIEYMHFDDTKNRFRFHTIEAVNGTVKRDDAGCDRCHGGRPNWDAYDSWAGALPYNRDRIYQDSHEEAAVKRLWKDLRDDPIVKQFDPPPGIIRDPATGDVTIAFDGNDPGDRVDVPYDKDADGNVTFPGDTGAVNVNRGGPFLTIHHSGMSDSDEGRGSALFDQLTAMNALRVAQELLDMPRDVVDIRPVALAIARDDCAVDAGNLGDYAPPAALDAFVAYHGMSFDDLRTDTRTRQEGLPREKANLQADNVRGLITAITGDPDPAVEFIVSDVFRRSNEGRDPDETALLKPDQLTHYMVDREFYDENNETRKIALFRFFLEPSKVRVGKWSMSVRDRSTTYTFGDRFSLRYIAKIVEKLGEAELSDASGTDPAKGREKTCAKLAADSRDWFDKAITNNPDYFKK